MIFSQRLLLPLALAFTTLSCLLPGAAQDATQDPDSQRSNKNSSTRLIVRKFSLHYTGSFKKISPDEIAQRLTQKGFLPILEQPYDQAKLELIKNEIKKLYQERGIAVGAQSVLNSTSTPRYVEVLIEVYKQ
jgi:hypothetical protein